MALDFSKYGKPVKAPVQSTGATPVPPTAVPATPTPAPAPTTSRFAQYGTPVTESAVPQKKSLLNFIGRDISGKPSDEAKPEGGLGGFAADVFQSTLGSKGLSGLAQGVTRPIVQKVSADTQMEINKSRQDLTDSANKFIEMASKETDPTRKKKLLSLAHQTLKQGETLKGEAEDINKDTVQSTSTLGDIEKIGGQAINTALTFAPMAKSGQVLSAAEKLAAETARKTATLGSKVATGAKTGAGYGAGFGAGSAMADEQSASDVLKSTAIGGATGLALGAATPLAIAGAQKTVGGIKSVFGNRAAQTAENTALLESKATDSRVATKMLEGGKMVTDKTAKEAVRQGIPEADVALVKGSSSADKIKMVKMLDIRESQLTNKRVTDRATDVVGDTFLNQAKFIEKTNKEAIKKLDVVASRLAGKRVDTTPALTQFSQDLEKAGVKMTKTGGLNFKGSDFEGIRGAQSAINSVWERAKRLGVTGDALQLHRTKRFIDNIVEYGKQVEGLPGAAQRILKSFRHNADLVLDTRFPAYNKVNSVLSETIGELNKIGESMGKRFRIGDTFADARAGVVLRRILSNTQSRSDILQMLESLQTVAKKHGMKIDEDIISQANFADMLEKMFGSEAPTSFLGQISRGLETFGSTGSIQGAQQIGSAASEFARGNVIRGTLKGATALGEQLMGISQENKVKALRALLKNGASKSVFGRAPVAEKLSTSAVDKMTTARYTGGMKKR